MLSSLKFVTTLPKVVNISFGLNLSKYSSEITVNNVGARVVFPQIQLISEK